MHTTSTQLIESHRSLFLWGDKCATDIRGFNARRVGLSEEATVVQFGETRDPSGPHLRERPLRTSLVLLGATPVELLSKRQSLYVLKAR